MAALCLRVDGFVPLGCDGSRLHCPRTPELEQRLRADPKSRAAPQVWVTAFVHLYLGLLWSWRLGGPRASEQAHLVQLLPTLPRAALIVADAGFVSYPLLQQVVSAGHWFLIRLKSQAPLYSRVICHHSRYPPLNNCARRGVDFSGRSFSTKRMGRQRSMVAAAARISAGAGARSAR